MTGESQKKPKMTIGACHIALGVCAFAFFLLYVYEVHGISKQNLQMERIASHIQKLKNTYTALEISQSENHSLLNLQAESAALSLEDVREVSYIEIKSHAPLVLNKQLK